MRLQIINGSASHSLRLNQRVFRILTPHVVNCFETQAPLVATRNYLKNYLFVPLHLYAGKGSFNILFLNST
jgi:hypothetical protein